ncbi:ATP-dependent RNA helicase DeaD [Fictibacillus solisalsi]|uniref:ATP-dependent RNA helicase DeaD n=1 Tax=Fictibacillus solisalsi TaxID=459525 RepID=A0A1H0BC47_9BACL|nr:DEAD/DEAH box helicase [Fictibacillus solisalsi]SDN43244.1 ATP-dependent RNA helicase DeaD [Fictibacillus solisalsi]
MADFNSMKLNPRLLESLKNQGIYEPTPVQDQVIPLLLEGTDVIAKSQTGTGKTMAFALPVLQRIDPEVKNVQALIVAPTRELAIQVAEEVKKLSEPMGIDVLSVYGGQDVVAQIHKLGGSVQIIIATPGRLLDHVRRETVDLSQTSMLVLDEADQMLHIGFLEDVEEIIRQTSKERQTMLFSATMPPEIVKLAETYLKKPKEISIRKKEITVKEIRQRVIETTDRSRQDDLKKLIRMHRPYLAIIFCRTKRRVSKLFEALREAGLEADELHGDLSQAKREAAMQRFRQGETRFLIATDVAARGLDVEGVTHVINYDIPHDTESYIHRIGRTGRAGSKGLAITLVAPKDKKYLELIEKGIRQSIQKQVLEKPERKKDKSSEEKKGSQNPRRLSKNKHPRR